MIPTIDQGPLPWSMHRSNDQTYDPCHRSYDGHWTVLATLVMIHTKDPEIYRLQRGVQKILWRFFSARQKSRIARNLKLNEDCTYDRKVETKFE